MGVLQAAEFRALAAIEAGLVGLDGQEVLAAGMRSCLPIRLGTQKLWITSAASSSSVTGRPTGMWISLAVGRPAAGRHSGIRCPTTIAGR